MTKTVHVEEGHIGKALFAFAMPVLISQLLQELYNAADCIMIGRFVGGDSLAAVSIAGIILSVFINFFIGFSSGVSAISSFLFGEYEYDRLKMTITTVARFVLLLGGSFALITYVFNKQFLSLLECPESVMSEASLYLRVCAAGIAAQLIYNTGTSILRSLGDCKSPLICFFISVIVNVALDILFVAAAGMGVFGAALATLIAQCLLAVLIIVKLYMLDNAYSLTLTGHELKASEAINILKMGIPAGMQAFFMSLSSLIIQVSIDSFGPAAMAGMSLYAKLEGVLYLPSFAYGIALTGFVGQNLGAGRRDRIIEAVRISNRVMWAVIFPLSIVITVLSPVILKVFTTDEAILFNAHEAVLFNLPLYIVYALNQVYLGAIKGLGKTFYPMICTLLSYSLFRVVWCNLLIPVFHTMRVVYLSYDVSFFIMLALLVPVYQNLISTSKSGSFLLDFVSCL